MTDRIVKAIKLCTKKKIEITPYTNLRDDLEFDSFDTIMLICELESEFDLNIDETDFVDIKTVADIELKIKEVVEC